MLIIYVNHKVTLFSFSYADVKRIIFPMLMFFVFFECLIAYSVCSDEKALAKNLLSYKGAYSNKDAYSKMRYKNISESFIAQFASSKWEKNERCHIPKGM